MAEQPIQREPIPGGYRFSIPVTARKTERQQKEARFRHFTIQCDEGAAIGGDDTAPPPLAYFASAVAF